MITEATAKKFATDWIRAWNDHDPDAILSHYSEDVEYFSPFLAKLAGHSSGTIRGNKALKDYLSKGLAAYPELKFVLEKVYWGQRSVVLQYQSVNNLIAAEVFEFDDAGLVCRVQCHYDRW
jgi:hypothetical protein